MGIGPISSLWRSEALPIRHTRLVDLQGIEPCPSHCRCEMLPLSPEAHRAEEGGRTLVHRVQDGYFSAKLHRRISC